MSNPSYPRYDRKQTYRWNYDHAPAPIDIEAPPVDGDWDFAGLPAASPLGIAAGPLLNGRWCLYYASLGFDVLTYKTVRSGQRECYDLPNLLPVEAESLRGDEVRVAPTSAMNGTWAVSFGMPSAEPDIWRRDIEWTRQHLAADKLLCVSTVGTMQPGWSLADLADDYAQCASWAVQSGADAVEINLSCPNVASCDGQLYQDPAGSNQVATTVRDAIGKVPLILKVGHFLTPAPLADLIDAVAQPATAIAMTNSIATKVGSRESELAFEGERRGICGRAIHEASVDQVRAAAEIIQQRRLDLKLIGVGGIDSASHVANYLQAGAHACHLATSPMVDPLVGIKIRQTWAEVL